MTVHGEKIIAYHGFFLVRLLAQATLNFTARSNTLSSVSPDFWLYLGASELVKLTAHVKQRKQKSHGNTGKENNNLPQK